MNRTKLILTALSCVLLLALLLPAQGRILEKKKKVPRKYNKTLRVHRPAVEVKLPEEEQPEVAVNTDALMDELDAEMQMDIIKARVQQEQMKRLILQHLEETEEDEKDDNWINSVSEDTEGTAKEAGESDSGWGWLAEEVSRQQEEQDTAEQEQAELEQQESMQSTEAGDMTAQEIKEEIMETLADPNATEEQVASAIRRYERLAEAGEAEAVAEPTLVDSEENDSLFTDTEYETGREEAAAERRTAVIAQEDATLFLNTRAGTEEAEGHVAVERQTSLDTPSVSFFGQQQSRRDAGLGASSFEADRSTALGERTRPSEPASIFSEEYSRQLQEYSGFQWQRSSSDLGSGLGGQDRFSPSSTRINGSGGGFLKERNTESLFKPSTGSGAMDFGKPFGGE